MLQTLREKTSGWIAFFILGAVSIPFAFFGINNYFTARTETFVARVGDAEITPAEFRARFDEFKDGIRRRAGDNYDARYFEQPTVKRQFLDRLVDEELLRQAAAAAGTDASDGLVRAEIRKVPAFQVDGKFNEDQYRLLLQGQQMTPVSFEERMRRDLSAAELPTQIAATVAVGDADVDRYLRLRDQTRDFRYAILPPAPASAQTEPTAEQVEAFHAEHQDEYMSPEQVSIEYLELDAATLATDATADEATLRERYAEQSARFVEPGQRLASHVLVQVAPDADAAAQKAALDEATVVATEARSGKDFAVLAKEHSDDIGSKSQGGDLGWVEKGVTRPQFEEALFALDKAGAISDPVKTDDGFHVILLREVREERSKPFEDVRADLEREFLDAERERVFSDRSSQLLDSVFADPTSLEPAAKALGLTVQRTPVFGREGGPGIAANPVVVEAAFSDAVLRDGNVSDLIELAPNHVVVLRVDEHHARKPRPLAEVMADVAARLRDDAARAENEKRAKALEARFLGGASLDDVAKEAGATVAQAERAGRTAVNHDAGVLAEVFKLARPDAGAPRRALVQPLPGAYALVELTGVTDGDPAQTDAAGRQAVRDLLARGESDAQGRAFVEALRAATEVTIVEERLQ